MKTSANILGQIAKIERLSAKLLAAELRAFDLTYAEFRLLGLLLGDSKGKVQTELCAQLRVKPPSLSAMLDRLVAKNLVARVPDAGDARRRRVRLATKAQDIDAVFKRVAALERRATAGLDRAQRAALRAALNTIVDNLEKGSPS